MPRRRILLAGALTLLGVAFAMSASARTFSGGVQGTAGFGIPIPVLTAIPGGTACPTCATSIPTAAATMSEALAVPARAFYLVTGPNVFPLPQPTSYPFLTSTTSGTFSNLAGTLSKGGGPGSLTWCPGLGVGPCTNNQGLKPGRFRIDQVGNQFGGTVRLSGILFNTINVQSGGGVLRGPLPVPLTGVGGPLGGTVTASGTITHSTLGFTLMAPATVTFLPWTTARIRVDDAVGVVASYVVTTGYDLRNSTGAGNIQLVTGWLTHLGGAVADDSLGQVVMTLALPEPTSTLMLGAGLSLLVGLYRVSRRR